MMRAVGKLIKGDRIRIGHDWFTIEGARHILKKRVKLKIKAIDQTNLIKETTIVLHSWLTVETVGTATDALREGWGAKGR